MRRHALPTFLTAVLATLGSLVAQVAADSWKTHPIERFGGAIDYPENVFAPEPREADEDDQVFVSTNDEARLAVGSWLNEGGFSPGELKNNLLRSAREASLTYEPGGKTWFVLSGYEGDDIYYQKIMFSCGGSVVTAFGLTYPTASRTRYDPIVERMEDSFRPGRQCP